MVIELVGGVNHLALARLSLSAASGKWSKLVTATSRHTVLVFYTATAIQTIIAIIVAMLVYYNSSHDSHDILL